MLEVPHRPHQLGPFAKAAQEADVPDERPDPGRHDDVFSARLREVRTEGIVAAANRLVSLIGLFELWRVAGHDDPLSDPDDPGGATGEAQGRGLGHGRTRQGRNAEVKPACGLVRSQVPAKPPTPEKIAPDRLRRRVTWLDVEEGTG